MPEDFTVIGTGTGRSLPSPLLEPLVCVSDEGEHHLRSMRLLKILSLLLPDRRVIRLVDILDREVFRVDWRVNLWLEWSLHVADSLPVDSGEVCVLLNFRCTMRASDMSKAV